MSANKKKKHFYDYSLVFTIIFVTVFGLVMIYSSSSYSAQLMKGDAAYYMKRQAMIALGGFVGMIVVSMVDYHRYLKLYRLSYIASLALMLAVSIIGVKVNGKRRWLRILGLQFQPTEIVKIAIIICLVVWIVRMGNQINTWSGFAKIWIRVLPLAGFVGINNLSSGIIILGIPFVVTFVANKNRSWYVLLGIVGIALLELVIPISTVLTQAGIIKEYQLSRIMVWKDPAAYARDGGYQVLQGLYAIGSGGLFGKGLGEGMQKFVLPESQNDMIFAIICEELGLFGAVSIILIFLFMIYRFLVIANSAPDVEGSLLVTGVMAHIAIQVILNIAVVTNSIPNTGVTLPFISYGGTSVLFLMVEMGLVLSVSRSIKLEYGSKE